jgi:hypothetical protein
MTLNQFDQLQRRTARRSALGGRLSLPRRTRSPVEGPYGAAMRALPAGAIGQ